MRRLTLLAKGNADVRDSLLFLREGDCVVWNGINALSQGRARFHVRHEVMTRSDALLGPRPTGSLPEMEGAFAPARQFETALFDGVADAVILSIQPDVMNNMVRHRADGHLLYPHEAERWTAEARAALTRDYAPVPSLSPEQSMDHMEGVIRRIGERPVLIYSMSAASLWDEPHDYRGIGETLANRIRAFNLALIDLSRRTGASIVDVDRLIARDGARALKRDMIGFTAEGCRAVAGEVLRILRWHGLVPE